MPLGPHVPAWVALRKRLDALVRDASPATLAAVVDEAGLLWCWSTPPPPLDDRWGAVVKLSDFVCATELAGTRVRLSHGAHLSVVREGTDAPKRRGHLTALPGGAITWRSYIAESFASYYVLVVWFDGSSDIARRQELVRSAVGDVMALTSALPPPDGPTASAGARRIPVPKPK